MKTTEITRKEFEDKFLIVNIEENKLPNSDRGDGYFIKDGVIYLTTIIHEWYEPSEEEIEADYDDVYDEYYIESYDNGKWLIEKKYFLERIDDIEDVCWSGGYDEQYDEFVTYYNNSTRVKRGSRLNKILNK